MGERLVHYSAKPISGPVWSVDQVMVPDMKPRGFWVSVEGNNDGWKEWCESENYNLRSLQHIHEIKLRDDAEILWLRTAADIDRFTAEWMPPNFRRASFYSIPWAPVAMTYQGIIIAPYIHERRLSDVAKWYYTWDCASGCIWDAAAIKSIRALEKEDSHA